MYQADRFVSAVSERYDRTSGDGFTQHEVFKQALSYDQWYEVRQLADRLGVLFFASPFDLEAVDVLEDMAVPLYKIASGDITYKPLIQKVAATGKPIVLSTGASTVPEITEALQWIHAVNPEAGVLMLVCTLSYPCNDDDAHLNRIKTWAQSGQPFVGYSDHTRGIDAPLIAHQLGAVLVEKHFTLRKHEGYDSDFAIDTLDAAEIVQLMGKRSYPEHHRMFGHGQIGPVYPAESAARLGARRSMYAARSLPAGHTISPSDIHSLRPGSGLSPARIDELVGVTLRRSVSAGTQFTESDLKPKPKLTAFLTVTD
jgi:sialic acid synthase SpsE